LWTLQEGKKGRHTKQFSGRGQVESQEGAFDLETPTFEHARSYSQATIRYSASRKKAELSILLVASETLPGT
jgi:hypothetical protein